MQEYSSGLWYAEHDSTGGTHHYYVKSILYDGRTEYQHVTILDTEEWGKTLVVDGEIQSTELDESIFHEAVVHPAMITHPHPRAVLILGSGEGAMLREVLSYRSVEQAINSDIDEEFVEICVEHLPEWSEDCFDESHVTLEFDDGMEYLRSCHMSFDIIIADLVAFSEGMSKASLHAKGAYRLLRDRLSSGGILVIHGLEFDPSEPHDFVMARNVLKEAFPLVLTYSTYIPSFRGESAFLIASDDRDPSQLSKDDISKRLAERGVNEDKDLGSTLYFYDADAHARMFSLPKNVKEAL